MEGQALKLLEFILPDNVVEGVRITPTCSVEKQEGEEKKREISADGVFVKWYRESKDKSSGSPWEFVSTGKNFTPSSKEVGLRLRAEAILKKDKENRTAVSKFDIAGPVIGAPPSPRDRTVYHVSGSTSVVERNESLQSLKLMTFNMLSPNLVGFHNYAKSWALDWEFRKWKIFKHVTKTDPDVLCLQEVPDEVFKNDLTPTLRKLMRYEGLRSTGKSQDTGCVIFYKSWRYKVVDYYTVDFHHLAKKNIHTKAGSDHFGRRNVALIALLEEQKLDGDKEFLCVVNVHLFWDPAYPEVKLWQAVQLMNELSFFLNEHQKKNTFLVDRVPRFPRIVMCGDLNSLPSSAVYEFLSKGKVEKDNKTVQKDPHHVLLSQNLFHEIPLVSAYSKCPGGEPKFTTYTKTFNGTLDYIWYADTNEGSAKGRDFRGDVRGLSLEEVLLLPSEAEVTTDVALPNPQYPSDHLSLSCRLSYSD